MGAVSLSGPVSDGRTPLDDRMDVAAAEDSRDVARPGVPAVAEWVSGDSTIKEAGSSEVKGYCSMPYVPGRAVLSDMSGLDCVMLELKLMTLYELECVADTKGDSDRLCTIEVADDRSRTDERAV